MKLGVIDYGAGNLRSVLNTFEAAGVHGHLVRTPEDAEGVTHLVLPGVGAFGDCAEKLRGQTGLSWAFAWVTRFSLRAGRKMKACPDWASSRAA